MKDGNSRSSSLPARFESTDQRSKHFAQGFTLIENWLNDLFADESNPLTKQQVSLEFF